MVLANPNVSGAGASGALWGVMVALAVWAVLNRQFLPPRLKSAWLRDLPLLFVLNIGISMMPQVSAAAHFGGGAIGLVAALLLNGQRYGSRLVRSASVAGLIVIPLLCVTAVVKAPSVDSRWEAITADRELHEFNRLLDPVGHVHDAANTVYWSQARMLLDRRDTRRNADDVARTIRALQEQQANLRKAIERMEQAGPYRTQRIEDARQARLHYLEEEQILLELAERHLQDRSNNELELKTQQSRLLEAKKRWTEALEE